MVVGCFVRRCIDVLAVVGCFKGLIIPRAESKPTHLLSWVSVPLRAALGDFIWKARLRPYLQTEENEANFTLEDFKIL